MSAGWPRPHGFETVAVIGAGTMGAGIAAQVANAGLPVLLLEQALLRAASPLV